MKILVTGSSGTIGTRLIEKLLLEGQQINGIDRRPNQWLPQIQQITTIADLTNPQAFDQLSTTDFDLVIHLAANARVYEAVKDPQLAYENIQTTFHTLEFVRQHQIPNFIFASSREVYGNRQLTAAPKTNSHSQAEPDTHIDHMESPYSASKFSGEALVKAYQQCYGLRTVIFRFSNVYGMYDDSDRLVPIFIRNLLANQPLQVFGAEKTLDFTYIDDAIAGIISAIHKLDTASGKTFNLAYGQGEKILDLANQLRQKVPQSQSTIEVLESRIGEVTSYTADISLAQQILNFQPKTDLQEGINQSLSWYLAYLK